MTEFNNDLRMSEDGLTALRNRERVIMRYYNDAANNCTFGISTLVHHGPCTDEEFQRPVTITDVNAQLTRHIRHAESAVRRRVTQTQLTQQQFDALVSFTYNVGANGARATLNAANRGNFHEVVRHMNGNVYVHPRNAEGKRLPPVRLQGLVNRRREEVAPFLNQETRP